MGTEAEVQIVADDGIKSQFGRGAFYRQNVQNSKTVRNVSLVAFGAAVVVLVFCGSPKREGEVKSSLLFAGDVHPQTEVHLPDHEAVQAQMQKDAAAMPKPIGKGLPKLKFSSPKLVARPTGVQIPPGTMVQAVLVSGGSNGLVKAQLKEPVMVNGETVIEENAVLVGQGSSTEERLFIRFTRAVLRDSTVVSIKAQAADFGDKIVGLSGSKVGHYAGKLAAAVGLNFVTGMSEGLQDTRVMNGVEVKRPTLKNALYNGTAMAASQQAQELLNSAKNKQPIIEVPAGAQIYVMFDDSGG